MTQLIGNASGAYGESLEFPGTQAPQYIYKDAYNAGATTIPASQWVGLDLTGTGVHVFAVTQGLHGGAANSVIGVAIDTIKPGAVGRVCVEGPCTITAGTGGLAAGNQLAIDTNASHDGQLLAAGATPVVGTIIGMALATIAAGATGPAWLYKA